MTVATEMSVSEKISYFIETLTNIAREHKFTLDVGPETKNCLRFYFKHGKTMTLKDLLENKSKYKDILQKLGDLFSQTGFILDSGDYSEFCPLVIRNHKTRCVVGYLEYNYVGEEEIIQYTFKKKI